MSGQWGNKSGGQAWSRGTRLNSNNGGGGGGPRPPPGMGGGRGGSWRSGTNAGRGGAQPASQQANKSRGGAPSSGNSNVANGIAKLSVGSSEPDVLRERFVHLLLNAIGLQIKATLMSGQVIEGILHNFTPYEKLSEDKKNVYVIKACRLVKKGNESGEIDFVDGSTVCIPSVKVSNLHIKSIRLDTGGPAAAASGGRDMFATDSQISGGKGGKNTLVEAGSAWTSAGDGTGGALEGGNNAGGFDQGKGADAMNWRSNKAPASGNSVHMGSLESGGKKGIGSWDQFAANKEKFNVSAAYDENLYTTKLDVDNVDSAKLREAERLAREIEGTKSSNFHVAEERNQQIQTDYDEEDLYSGVLTKDMKARSIQKSDGNDEPQDGSKDDETKEEGTAETKTENEKSDEKEEKKADEKDSGKPEEKKPSTKLNPNAKSFTFNPGAKSFTPSFGQAPPAAPPQPLAPPAGPLPGEYAPHPMGAPPPQFVPGGMMPPQMPPQMRQQYPHYPPQPMMPPPPGEGGDTSTVDTGDNAGDGGPNQQFLPYGAVPPPYPGYYPPNMHPAGRGFHPQPMMHPQMPPQMGYPPRGPYGPGGPMHRGPPGPYGYGGAPQHYPPGGYPGEDEFRGGGRGGNNRNNKRGGRYNNRKSYHSQNSQDSSKFSSNEPPSGGAGGKGSNNNSNTNNNEEATQQPPQAAAEK